MKTLLHTLNEIKPLKRNSKLQANQIYLLSSESVAKNLYFESKKDIRFAHETIKKYIRYIGEVVDYLIRPTGWIIIIRTHSESSIIS